MRPSISKSRASMFAVALCVVATSCGFADARPTLLVDVATGKVLEAVDADASWHPASLTKLMTAAVVLKGIREGRYGEDAPVVFSSRAAEAPPSKLGAPRGATLRLGDALHIMLTRSMNDVAIAVAESLAGSEPAFAALMNAEASRLGMHGTHFVNASGLHDAEQVSTAEDLAILARHLILDYPERAYLFSTPRLGYGARTLKNTNGLLVGYHGARGMKTGYVCASGFNLVAYATREGRSYLSVVLGEGSVKGRERKAAALLDLGFSGELADGEQLTSHATAHRPAPDLRLAACGKGNVPAVETYVEAPTPAPRPERWKFGGSLDDYDG